VRFVLLMLIVLWAVSAPAPKPIKWYFRAQVVYTLALQVALLWGVQSRIYLWSWVACTAFVLLAASWLALYYVLALSTWPNVLFISLVISLFISILALSGVPVSIPAYVNIIAGGILVFLAIAVGMAFVCLRCEGGIHVRICGTFTYLWLAQAIWFFGWPMHWHLPAWERLNFFVPTALMVVAFYYLGLKLRNAYPAVRATWY
jgi:hypothetical protein